MQVDWQDASADVIVFVRSEAAGMVTGKQGFVVNQIRKQSGASVQLMRDEVQNTRPCRPTCPCFHASRPCLTFEGLFVDNLPATGIDVERGFLRSDQWDAAKHPESSEAHF